MELPTKIGRYEIRRELGRGMMGYYLARALAKDPADRYPDGTRMAEDAEDILARRPPRHRHGWVEPRRADGTLVSSAGSPSPATPAADPPGTDPAETARKIGAPATTPLDPAPPRPRTAAAPGTPAGRKETPGTHEVRVQVTWDGGVKTKHIAGHFSAGTTRRLSAKLGVGVRGFVQKDLKLEWE